MKFNKFSYSDKKLELLSKQNLDERGSSPWFEWVSEIYSLGKTFRENCKFPKLLCLPVSSDHGVNIQSTYDEYERSTKGPYLTWNYKKYKKIIKSKRQAYFVKHPWIDYKDKINFQRNPKRNGTIVFFPKSIHSLKVNKKFIDEYINKLKKLPQRCKPITICLFYYDINQKLHKELRKYKFPIVTVGNSSSKYFVDRFYELISNFKYATSPLGGRPGSYFYFCVDAKIPFFFYGRNLKYYSEGNKIFKKGKINLYQIFSLKYSSKSEYKKMIKTIKSFLKIEDRVTKKQLSIVREYLGYNSSISNTRLNVVFWKSFFVNLISIIKIYKSALFRNKS